MEKAFRFIGRIVMKYLNAEDVYSSRPQYCRESWDATLQSGPDNVLLLRLI